MVCKVAGSAPRGGKEDVAELRGKTIKSGGSDCVFDEEFDFDVVDHKTLCLSIWDDDLGADDLIGECEIDLLQVYKRGFVDKWIDLEFEKPLGCCGRKGKAKDAKIADLEEGGAASDLTAGDGDKPPALVKSSTMAELEPVMKIKAGEVRVQMTFFGDEGVFYPARVGPEDEILRAKLEKKHAKELEVLKKKFEDLKQEKKMSLIADEQERIMKLGLHREKEDVGLIAEIEEKKKKGEEKLRTEHKKAREEEENFGDGESGVNTFEMLSPLAQGQYEQQAEEDLKKDVGEMLGKVGVEFEKRKEELAKKRAKEDEEAGGQTFRTSSRTM